MDEKNEKMTEAELPVKAEKTAPDSGPEKEGADSASRGRFLIGGFISAVIAILLIYGGITRIIGMSGTKLLMMDAAIGRQHTNFVFFFAGAFVLALVAIFLLRDGFRMPKAQKKAEKAETLPAEVTAGEKASDTESEKG